MDLLAFAVPAVGLLVAVAYRAVALDKLAEYHVAALIGTTLAALTFLVLRFSLSQGQSEAAPVTTQETPHHGSPEPERESPPPRTPPPTRSPPSPPTPPPSRAAPPAPARPPRPNPARPVSPRTTAQALVGTRLGAAQAMRAAEAIVSLAPFVAGRRSPALDEIWGFFEMPKPPGGCFNEKDAVAQTLKTKLNRQRLLLHPDKNAHPDAELTFKFLEQCHMRLVGACMRTSGWTESVAQRTRREEEELKLDQERRRKQEAERRAFELERQRQEDEKERQRLQQEEDNIRKAKMEQKRLEWMLRDSEARAQAYMERIARRKEPPAVVTGIFATTCSPKCTMPDLHHFDVDPAFMDAPLESPRRSVPLDHNLGDTQEALGDLTLRLVAAKDLPAGGLFESINTYAAVRIGRQHFKTKVAPGSNPAWGSTFRLQVCSADHALHIGVWREGWTWGLVSDRLLGSVEVPFLDLDEWSGCVIGRILEPADPMAPPESQCMVVELKASFEWF